jgi:hypothetical protein
VCASPIGASPINVANPTIGVNLGFDGGFHRPVSPLGWTPDSVFAPRAAAGTDEENFVVWGAAELRRWQRQPHPRAAPMTQTPRTIQLGAALTFSANTDFYSPIGVGGCEKGPTKYPQAARNAQESI